MIPVMSGGRLNLILWARQEVNRRTPYPVTVGAIIRSYSVTTRDGCIEGSSHRTGTRLSFCFFGPVGVTLLCNLSGPRPILMDAVIQIQGLVLRPGMGIVPGRKCGLLLRWCGGGQTGLPQDGACGVQRAGFCPGWQGRYRGHHDRASRGHGGWVPVRVLVT